MGAEEKNIIGQSAYLLDCLFYFMAEGAAYWPDHKALILADLHLGKVTHFRKAGIAVPLAAKDQNWRKLNDCIESCMPEQIIFLGDLFHSKYNREWEEMLTLMENYSSLKFRLVKGNHDILDDKIYSDSPMEILDSLVMDPFIMTHHPMETIEEGYFNLCGHVHPAVRLMGQAKQSVKLSCFYITEQQMIFPAFGAFTGNKTLDIEEASNIYAIVEQDIIQLK